MAMELVIYGARQLGIKAKIIFFTTNATNNGWNIVISIVYNQET